ncbi:type II toxin-antitoxin system VapC family toxin [Luteolibacter arcticus]|uniref:Type II toxin-antitoxin system VapC family toxin n=1 Tax=Luteolibacter arcticus TaxID=1581411 RepID=A0ABT3GFB4_9BACT|nr:type II toxin-antitoxin system VapC family toxin [Luteolibacter arcticus]MCW1922307.1 type II toxin-antitoxin system VapC family toxin [Luteolibacter arcticus]
MLLDTNIVIHACQPGGNRLDPWTTHPNAAIASVTKIEALGFAGISPEEETAILNFVAASPVYSLDDGVIERAIKLRQQKKMKLGDAIIAATALEYDMPLVTRNEADFKHIAGLDVRNPFAITP